jgi:hypothetical protein
MKTSKKSINVSFILSFPAEEHPSDDQRDCSDFDRSNEQSSDKDSSDESTEDRANSISEIEYSDGNMEGDLGGEGSDDFEDIADGPSVSKDTARGKVGFLEGGKVESFSRAFARLVKDDGVTAKTPILSVRMSSRVWFVI